MDERTAGELAALAGATLVGDPSVVVGPEVVIDSRAVTPGALFVALPGERADGHDFAFEAAGRGAAAVLVERDLGLGVPQLVVPDALAGLAALARGIVAGAAADGLRRVAITGSSGKTSTKDLLAAVLRSAGPTVAPVGSFNNEIGVPLTATAVDAATRYLVSEFGARGPGHIAALAGIVPPEVGVVLNVGHAHLGEFGSVAAIAAAKGELVEALPADGWAVLNADDEAVAAMATRTTARLACWSLLGRPGTGEKRLWAEEVTPDRLQRHSFTLHVDTAGESASTRVSLRVAGAQQVGNALAAAGAALALGLDLARVGEALSGAAPASRWRMELHERPDGLLVVNDAYNANPDSMRAALVAVAALRRPSGRVVAVLGDMLELGLEAAAQHEAVGELAGSLGLDAVIAVGGHAGSIVAGAARHGIEAIAVPDRHAALAAALGLVSPPDVVLVKASRGIALETVADALAAGAEAPGT
ncbi:MAG TPA: UDP-N-acetylmuramoyl-tripeptide--D-alanyl-D-alanine ligase [Propionicimonas sp.]|jgi:UDP-N-acetylmuramoyl-tripeptide--D-alanyl-D-alanine ligase|nr:UDP-N-acetylmuramoyl-tripeptide--D-alanyl-D-alanine ligase [Propionicimonas sp.]